MWIQFLNWEDPLEQGMTTHSWRSEVKSLSRVWLFATPWTVTYQAPPSMGFSRQEYWSGLPFPSPGIFHSQGSNPGLPHRRQMLLPSEPPGKPGESMDKEAWQAIVHRVTESQTWLKQLCTHACVCFWHQSNMGLWEWVPSYFLKYFVMDFYFSLKHLVVFTNEVIWLLLFVRKNLLLNQSLLEVCLDFLFQTESVWVVFFFLAISYRSSNLLFVSIVCKYL